MSSADTLIQSVGEKLESAVCFQSPQVRVWAQTTQNRNWWLRKHRNHLHCIAKPKRVICSTQATLTENNHPSSPSKDENWSRFFPLGLTPPPHQPPPKKKERKERRNPSRLHTRWPFLHGFTPSLQEAAGRIWEDFQTERKRWMWKIKR